MNAFYVHSLGFLALLLLSSQHHSFSGPESSMRFSLRKHKHIDETQKNLRTDLHPTILRIAEVMMATNDGYMFQPCASLIGVPLK